MKTSQQFFTFAGIGAIGTAGHYATLILLVQSIQTDPVIASTTGFIVGALINYILNYRITFNSNKRHRETSIKFFSVALLGAVINGAIMSAGINMFDVHYLIIQVTASCIVLAFNFTANKYWTFANNQSCR
ncbi:MAG: GtrA family protein [Gammaproteobacteria bacterium]|nr:GtrA family protein [Gammaproteobacteria bacterium]